MAPNNEEDAMMNRRKAGEARSAPEGPCPEGSPTSKITPAETSKISGGSLEGLAPARECWVLWRENGGPCAAMPILDGDPPGLRDGYGWVRMVPAPAPAVQGGA